MLDLRCYFVTGKSEDLVERCAAAAAGGAGVIQVRSKPIEAGELYHLAGAIADRVEALGTGTKVLIDDRVDVALALRAAGKKVHGVHVGQDDLPVAAVRSLLGPDAIVGLTTGTLELVEKANELADLIDYVGCGPFRHTPTKDSGRTPLGVAGYPPIVATSRVPVVAIGDVTVADVAALSGTGVAGVAVVREIMNAPDPAAVAQSILQEFGR